MQWDVDQLGLGVRRTVSGEEKMWKNTLLPGIFHKGPSLTGLRVKVCGAIECWQVVTQAVQMWKSICSVVIIQAQIKCLQINSHASPAPLSR